jgi:hypothetical protein
MRQICFFINERPEFDSNGDPVLDSKGNVKYVDMTASETQDARARASEALKKLQMGTEFPSVHNEFDENKQDNQYSSIYIGRDSAMGSDPALEKIYTELQNMKVGEIRLIETESNLHIVEKLELVEGAYDDSANVDFFSFYDPESDGLLTFEGYLVEPLFLEYIAESLEKFSADIKIDTDALNKKKLSNVKANYNY